MKTATVLLCLLAVSLLAGAEVPPQAAAGGAALSGVVRWAGPPRTTKPFAVTQDAPACGATQPDEALIVDGDGGVRDAVVALVGVPGAARPAGVEARLDQKGCRFLPHVQALPAGSTLVIGNSDNVLHNVHAVRNKTTAFNVAMPQPDRTITKKLNTPGLYSMRCDAGHTWMSAHVWTFDHPYFALTGAGGRFRIPDVPPGKYTLRVWHEGWTRESAGSAATVPVIVEQPVEIVAGKPTELRIELR